MSRPKSKLSKILRDVRRREKRHVENVNRYRKPGETDDMMEARMKRDLDRWDSMMTERKAAEETPKEN